MPKMRKDCQVSELRWAVVLGQKNRLEGMTAEDCVMEMVTARLHGSAQTVTPNGEVAAVARQLHSGFESPII